MYTQVRYLPLTHNWTLRQVNYEQVKILIPSIIFSVMLMVMGVLGNSLVIYVYWKRFKSSTHRCFILTLAVCDVITSSIGMPFLIVDMLYPYMFTNVLACRTFRFVNYLTSCISICTLFLIAIERYRKICRPLEGQITISQSKQWIPCFACMFGTAMALPSIFMYGHSTIYTGVNDIYDVQCFTDDSVK